MIDELRIGLVCRDAASFSAALSKDKDKSSDANEQDTSTHDSKLPSYHSKDVLAIIFFTFMRFISILLLNLNPLEFFKHLDESVVK